MGWRGWLAALAVLLAGTAAFAAATDGFQAVTSEGARRLDVSRAPRPLPPVELQDQDGRVFRLGDDTNAIVVAEFIYTRCFTLCTLLGDGFAQIGRQFGPALDSGRLALLSISFDSDHDDLAALKAYAAAHGADGRHWRIARFVDPEVGRRLLKTLDVVVIPDGEGGFTHNAAAYVLNRAGRLSAILDPAPSDELIRALTAWL